MAGNDSKKKRFGALKDAQIQALRPDGFNRMVEFSDSTHAGLKLRVTASRGDFLRAWTWRFLDKKSGKEKRIIYGTWPTLSYDEAVKLHLEARETHRSGADPIQSQVQAVAQSAGRMTVSQLVAAYEKTEVPHKKSGREILRIINKHIVPHIGELAVADVTEDMAFELINRERARIAEVIAAYAAKNPDASPRSGIAVTRFYKALRALFKHGLKLRVIKTSPVPILKAGDDLPEARGKRRPLSDAEIASFWAGLDTTGMSDSVKNVLRLILLTGCRPGEILKLQRKHCLMDEKVSDLRSGDTVERGEGVLFIDNRKSGDALAVPMTPAVRNIVNEVLKTTGEKQTAYLFPSGDGHIKNTALSTAFRRGRVRLGFPAADNVGPHCLRATTATLAAKLGFGAQGAEIVLGHNRNSTADKHYLAYDGAAVRLDILAAVEKHITKIIGEPPTPKALINRKTYLSVVA